MAEPGFHLFPHLPLELRQQIWEFSMAPREVVIVKTMMRRSSPALPPVLKACAESRSWLQKFYQKCFVRRRWAPNGSVEYFCWVNFAIDTIYMMDYNLADFSNVGSIRSLILEVPDVGRFYDNTGNFSGGPSYDPNLALETLVIIDLGAGDDNWWANWLGFMEALYFRCNPFLFQTRIGIAAEQWRPELTRDNWLRWDRASRRELYERDLANNPQARDTDEDLAPSDDDDDPRTSSFRTWQHTRSCPCPNDMKPAYL